MEREERGRIGTDDRASSGRGQEGLSGGEPGAGAPEPGRDADPPAQQGGTPTAQGGAATAERTEAGGPAPGTADSAESAPLLSDQDASKLEQDWESIQIGFIDEPQRCVQEADALVAEVMQHLADAFARERKDLEAQWAAGGEASTEDLRVALQRYRSFFNRLLKTTA